MANIKISSDLQLVLPDPDRDAAFALAWFDSPHGKDTLLRMGNAESEIEKPTLEGETATLNEFLQLERENKQITRMIQLKGRTIGAVWVDLEDTQYLKAPALHIMIGDPESRGMGIGKAVMKSMITYAKTELQSNVVYSRHLVSNGIVATLVNYLGFMNDGEPYTEKSGLTFQNIKIGKF